MEICGLLEREEVSECVQLHQPTNDWKTLRVVVLNGSKQSTETSSHVVCRWQTLAYMHMHIWARIHIVKHTRADKRVNSLSLSLSLSHTHTHTHTNTHAHTLLSVTSHLQKKLNVKLTVL